MDVIAEAAGLSYNELRTVMEDLVSVYEHSPAMYPPSAIYQQLPDTRRPIGHSIPESPPDSGSENPYSPTEIQHSIQGEMGLVPEHMQMPMPSLGMQYDKLEHGLLGDVVVLSPDQSTSILELGKPGVQYSNDYQNRFPHVEAENPNLILSQGMVLSGEVAPVYTSLQSGPPSVKKRKHSQDIKREPLQSPDRFSPHLSLPVSSECDLSEESSYQCIQFSPFNQAQWHSLTDAHLNAIQPPFYKVDADKGFNYSHSDEAYVCQKKNHFQITCNISFAGDPNNGFVKTPEGPRKIIKFCLHFYGVKFEAQNQTIKVEQSRADRSKQAFDPVEVQIKYGQTYKSTVGRLHFAETTGNNMRKKGKPNPDQRYFLLVVGLHAHTQAGEYMIVAQASEKIIVRASNPGQFESECSESCWQRGAADNVIFYQGRVGINTASPDEACVIHGNLKITGEISHPSDARAKNNIQELDTAKQLQNVQNIRLVKFNYDPEFAQHSGLLGHDPSALTPQTDTGVIAQEVRSILPEAVKEAGDIVLANGDRIDKFLVVNRDRLYMEGLGAVKELNKRHGNLETRVDQLERINRKLCKIGVLQRRDSGKSIASSDSRYSGTSASNSIGKSFVDGNLTAEQIREIARSIRRQDSCQKHQNSPKHQRKQCKNCKDNDYLKYNKNYNSKLQTTVKYYTAKHQSLTHDLKKCRYLTGYNSTLDSNSDCQTHQNCQTHPNCQTHSDCLSQEFQKNCQAESRCKTLDCGSEIYENIGKDSKKSNDSYLWISPDDSLRCVNANFVACCQRKTGFNDRGSDLLSSRFLHIVISALIIIMAVCLAVMSVLYFREHQARVDTLQRYGPTTRVDHSHDRYGAGAGAGAGAGDKYSPAHPYYYSSTGRPNYLAVPDKHTAYRRKYQQPYGPPNNSSKDLHPNSAKVDAHSTVSSTSSHHTTVNPLTTKRNLEQNIKDIEESGSNVSFELERSRDARAVERTTEPVGRPAGCPLEDAADKDGDQCKVYCCSQAFSSVEKPLMSKMDSIKTVFNHNVKQSDNYVNPTDSTYKIDDNPQTVNTEKKEHVAHLSDFPVERKLSESQTNDANLKADNVKNYTSNSSVQNESVIMKLDAVMPQNEGTSSKFDMSLPQNDGVNVGLDGILFPNDANVKFGPITQNESTNMKIDIPSSQIQNDVAKTLLTPQNINLKSDSFDYKAEVLKSEISNIKYDTFDGDKAADKFDTSAVEVKEPETANFIVGEDRNLESSRSRRRRDIDDVMSSHKSSEEVEGLQGSDLDSLEICDSVTMGIQTATFSNDTVFVERVCSENTWNFTYNIPLSKYMRNEDSLKITFYSPKIKKYELCELECKDGGNGNTVDCQMPEIRAKVSGNRSFTLPLDTCFVEKIYVIRARIVGKVEDLCNLPRLHSVKYLQYNIRLFRDCRHKGTKEIFDNVQT